MDEWENTLMARENGVVEAKHALGRTHMECDATHDWAGAVLQFYRAKLRASRASRPCSLEFDWVLGGHQFILSVQRDGP
jgi:hypothetical protein